MQILGGIADSCAIALVKWDSSHRLTYASSYSFNSKSAAYNGFPGSVTISTVPSAVKCSAITAVSARHGSSPKKPGAAAVRRAAHSPPQTGAQRHPACAVAPYLARLPTANRWAFRPRPKQWCRQGVGPGEIRLLKTAGMPPRADLNSVSMPSVLNCRAEKRSSWRMGSVG